MPVTTASCIDFPHQQQVIGIVDNLSLFTAVLDHASPGAPELLLPAPFDLETITDAALEAQRMTERSRILAHERRAAS